MATDDALMDACETLARAMYRGIGSCVVHRIPNGPWVADIDSSQGLLMSAAATSKRAAIVGLYCALWASAARSWGDRVPASRFSLVREAMAQTEGLFGLPQGNDDPSP